MGAYFDYVIASQQVIRSKPDPQMYPEALHNTDLIAEERTMFEDTENSTVAAHNTGIDVIIVDDKEKCKYSDALMTIRGFGDYRLYQEF